MNFSLDIAMGPIQYRDVFVIYMYQFSLGDYSNNIFIKTDKTTYNMKS